MQNLGFLHQNKPAKLVSRQIGDHLVLTESSPVHKIGQPSLQSTSHQFIAAGGGGGGYQDIEKFKLERKRERNRIAATKCRLVHCQYIVQQNEIIPSFGQLLLPS